MNASMTAEMSEEMSHWQNRVSGIDVNLLSEEQIRALHERSLEKKVGDLCSCGQNFIRKVFALLPIDESGTMSAELRRVYFPECANSCYLPTPT